MLNKPMVVPAVLLFVSAVLLGIGASVLENGSKEVAGALLGAAYGTVFLAGIFFAIGRSMHEI